MKPLEALDHYEVLEVGMSATAEQIEKAYRMLQVTYAPDSLAVYSLLDPADVAAMNERLETAFEVLSDEEERKSYDESLRDAEEPENLELASGAQGVAATKESSRDLGDADDEDQEPVDFDGLGLRLARERRSISLEQIASMTKINPTYLRWIEDNSYEELPALVYVRGFVTSYARAIGLDPERVAASYMSHLEQARSNSPRGRRPGGK